MKFLLNLYFNQKRAEKSSRTFSKQEMFQKVGREQFKELLKKGLNIPVVLL